jgi:hypothetical protein
MEEQAYERREGKYVSQKRRPGSVFRYTVDIPRGFENAEKRGLIFGHDGTLGSHLAAMDRLSAAGEAPLCIHIGVPRGVLPATLEGGFNRDMRMNEYDIFDRSYTDFVVDELIPYVLQTEGLSVSDDPDMHLVCGGSSGGISSWNMAWFRPDYFHRVYMSSPSFLSMGNGREMQAVMRKFETKPVRVWTEYSENEPDEYFGSSFAAALDAVRALRFAGYDCADRYFPGEGHCSGRDKEDRVETAYRFLWKDWESVPVRAPKNSHRFDRIFAPGEGWTACGVPAWPDRLCAPCPGNGGVYRAEGKEIYFEKDGSRTAVASFARPLSAIALSSDGWRLYVGAADAHCLYAMSVMPDGTLSGRYIHGAMHDYTDFAYPGATDLCVDAHDRIFAATECGIQCVRSYGLIDAIAPLPADRVPERVMLTVRDGERYLIASSEDGCWMRKLMPDAQGKEEKQPFPHAYYD